ncbi:MAG TPA: DUF72 domain-containing protein [Actinomycetota bacterium]|nr:DUF72 domain-containing protein [Actinomycetota bacterium]
MSGTLFVGTSGFAYREWKPEFYPPDLKNADMLAFYAREFPSVEINNTFYRSPTEKVLKQWLEQTPPTFTFTLKAPQRITHIARLGDVGEAMEQFLRTAKALDTRLGCILFQCPPNLKYDASRLDGFLAHLPGDPFRFAMEFRNETWNCEEVHEKLRANNVAWCVADTDEKKAPMVRTAGSFVYLRLRGLNYSDDDLAAWADEVRSVLDGNGDAYVYFKHEDDPSGVRFARAFRAMIGVV